MELKNPLLFVWLFIVCIYIFVSYPVDAAETNCPLVIYSDTCRDFIYTYSPDYNWTYVVPVSYQGQEVSFKYLVVAGGGDGGLANQPPLGQTWGYGGGGGAGGLLYNDSWFPQAGEIYNIYPGRGKENSTMYNASYPNITSVRGGDGGFGEIDLNYGEPGKNGGSGSGAGSGGSGGYPPWQNRTGGGTGIPGQGFDGGFSFGGYALTMAGGGGGAGGPGGNGVGGPGRTLNITFTNYTFSEGGEGETAILAPCKTTYGSGGRGWWQPQVGDTCRFGNPGIIIIQECYAQGITRIHNLNPPKLVQFTIMTTDGGHIEGANVSIVGLSTTAVGFEWVETMFGIRLGEAPIESTYMSGLTDSIGDIEFLMVPTTRYLVTVTANGYTFPETYIYPHDEEYVVFANDNETTSGWILPENGGKELEVTTTRISSTVGSLAIRYNDSAANTVGGFVNVTQDGTLLYSIPAATTLNEIRNVTIPEQGTSVIVSARIITSGKQWNSDKTVSFSRIEPLKNTFMDGLLLLIAVGLMFGTAFLSGIQEGKHVAFIVALEGWTFLGFGWLSPVVDKLGFMVVFATFSLGTFLVVLWNMKEGLDLEGGL